MSYRIPLSDRIRQAANKRWRYRTDPQYRLACINKERVRRGREPLAELPESSLAEMLCPHRPNRPTNWQRQTRDQHGRFA